MKFIKLKANLIPYCIEDGFAKVYLSHRSITAKQYPDLWSFWSGGIEKGETPEVAMLREIQEELNWAPITYKFLGTYYDSMPNEKFISYTKVGGDFEKQIKIQESQGGKFFTREEIEKDMKIIPEDKKVLFDLFDLLSNVVIE